MSENENLAKGPDPASKPEGKQSSTEWEISASRSFLRFLRLFPTGLHSKRFRDNAFQDFSIAYNKALQDGDYETAVICLMMNRLIHKAEEHPNDARRLAEIAEDVITKGMLGQKTR